MLHLNSFQFPFTYSTFFRLLRRMECAPELYDLKKNIFSILYIFCIYFSTAGVLFFHIYLLQVFPTYVILLIKKAVCDTFWWHIEVKIIFFSSIKKIHFNRKSVVGTFWGQEREKNVIFHGATWSILILLNNIREKGD